MPTLSDLNRFQNMPEGWASLGDLADAGNAQTLGQRINFPGSQPDQGPGAFSRFWNWVFGPSNKPVSPAAMPSKAPTQGQGSGGPYVNPDTAKAISDYFNGK